MALKTAISRVRRWPACLVAASLCFASGELRGAAPVKRARPPKFTKSIQDAFFPDANEKLVGPRDGASNPDAPSSPAVEKPPQAAAGEAWSRLIAAEMVVDEIKAQQRKLAQAVQNAATFKGGGFQQARIHLSVLAAMFGIAATYDAPVRWKREAPA